MEYRDLGRTDVLISSLCLGTMNVSEPTTQTESIRIIDRSLDLGINCIDTANL